MYYSKLYRQKGEVLLAACDRAVHDKTFDNGEISFHVSPSFYGSDPIEEEELLSLFEKSTIMNLAGEMCINLAIESGYVDSEKVIKIGECSHAQVISI